MENDETMFDEIVRTEIKPDGTVEASLVENSAQEMEAAVADMVKAWKDFKDASGDYPNRGVELRMVESLGVFGAQPKII